VTGAAQAAYDVAVARNAVAWATYDVAARDPQADDRAAWGAYYATIDPLALATAALYAPPPARPELGQMTLFDVEEGAA
jgi:hypothetical protein